MNASMQGLVMSLYGTLQLLGSPLRTFQHESSYPNLLHLFLKLLVKGSNTDLTCSPPFLPLLWTFMCFWHGSVPLQSGECLTSGVARSF